MVFLPVRNYVLDDLRRSSKPFEALKTLLQDKREIPILCSNVISKVERYISKNIINKWIISNKAISIFRREPNLLKIVMQSANKFSNVQNTFLYSTSPIFPINVFPMMQSEGMKSFLFFISWNIVNFCFFTEKNPLAKTIYSGLHYLKIGSKKQNVSS